MADLTWVTLICAISDSLTRTRTQHGGRGDVLKRQATAGRDLLGPDEVLQRLHRGVHDVDRVRRTQALGQHVVDAGALEHGTHRTTGDDTGTGAGRLEQHDTGRRLTLHRVRDGAGDARHGVEVLLGLLDALGDGRGHLLGLAIADADLAVAVTHDHQGGEAEAPTTLDDLGHAVDGNHALDVVALLGRRATGAPPAVTTVAAGVSPPRAAAPALWALHQTSLSILEIVLIRSPAPPRGRRRPGRRSARRTGCRPGRRRPWRPRPPSRGRRSGCRPDGPGRTCRPRRRGGRPPSSRRWPACGRRCRPP